MDNSFKLEILVPSGKILAESVLAVTLPTEMGEVGVLPGHASYTTTLGTGILEYALSNGRSGGAIVISGGIAQYSGDTLRVLADTVDLKDKVKKGEYDKGRDELEASLTNVDITTPEWSVSKAKLDRMNSIDALLR